MTDPAPAHPQHSGGVALPEPIPMGTTRQRKQKAPSMRNTPSSVGDNGQQQLVSVVIPTFNTERTVQRAVRSVWAQDYDKVEVIVVDDGSQDETVRVVSEMDGGSIDHLVTFHTNQGASAARNAGLAVAKGEYVAFLDADDAWRPSKLSRQVEAMALDREVTLVTCDSLLIRPTGEPPVSLHADRGPTLGPDAWKELLADNFIPTPTVLARRELVTKVGGFDQGLPVGEDLDLWIRLAERGKVGCVHEVLVEIYSLPGSLMKSYVREEGTIVMAMINKHLREQHKRLIRSEVRLIRARRSYQFATTLVGRGAVARSWPWFIRAALRGYRPLDSLMGMVKGAARSVLRLPPKDKR